MSSGASFYQNKSKGVCLNKLTLNYNIMNYTTIWRPVRLGVLMFRIRIEITVLLGSPGACELSEVLILLFSLTRFECQK